MQEGYELIKNCIGNLKDSKYENVYSTKFAILRDTRILEYYIENLSK